jgi:hypothetical protein
MTITATITAELYARAITCASTDAPRPYIAGVRVEPHKDGGTILIATDGHCAVVIRDFKGFASEAFTLALPKSLLKECKPSRLDKEPTIWIEDGAAKITGLMTRDWLVDMAFPDWRRIVPQTTPDMGCMASFDNRVLSRLAGALTGDKVQTLVLKGTSDTDPHIVFGTLSDAFGVAMPIRVTNSIPNNDFALPAWF